MTQPVPAQPGKKAELLPILMAEAEKFADQKNFQDALLVYNQALAEAGHQKDRDIVIDAVEKLMVKAPAQVLEEFLNIKNLTIPADLLRYYTGLNYATNGEYEQAVIALKTFIETFPDHRYVTDAKELLASVKPLMFNRETIGCLLPLSGKYEVFGQRALKGIQMAVQDMSLALNRPFRVVVKDTRSDPDNGPALVEELARENVLGIVGPLLSPEAAGQKAEALKIPLIALTQKSEFPLQGEYLFSNFITPEMQVQTLGAYIFAELGLKKVAILYPKEKYGETYMTLFWNVVDEFHGEVVGVESYDGSNTDFSVPLQKLTGEYYPVPEFLKADTLADPAQTDATQGADVLDPGQEPASPGLSGKPWPKDDPDVEVEAPSQLSSRGSTVANQDRIKIDFQALFIPDALSRVNLILPQLAFHDATGMVLLGTNLWHQDSLITDARGYNKNAVITDGYFGESGNPVTADFHRRFQELYEEKPGFLEAIAYDTAKILFTAAAPEGVASRTDVRNMLQGGQFYEGATGRTIFDKTGSPHKELFLITVKRGRFMEIRR